MCYPKYLIHRFLLGLKLIRKTWKYFFSEIICFVLHLTRNIIVGFSLKAGSIAFPPADWQQRYPRAHHSKYPWQGTGPVDVGAQWAFLIPCWPHWDPPHPGGTHPMKDTSMVAHSALGFVRGWLRCRGCMCSIFLNSLKCWRGLFSLRFYPEIRGKKKESKLI